MAEQGRQTLNLVRLSRKVPASETVAARLQLSTGAPVWELERLRHLDGEPISLDHTFLPADIGQVLVRFDLEKRDVFEVFETELGIQLAQARLEIEALPATKEMAKVLQMKSGAPILKVQRLTSSSAGRAIDFEYLYYRADRFRYEVHINRHIAGG